MNSKQPVTATERELIRTTEAQVLFGVGKSKFWSWVTQGYFPVFRPDGEKGRTTFVRKSDVTQFITTGKPVAHEA